MNFDGITKSVIPSELSRQFALMNKVFASSSISNQFSQVAGLISQMNKSINTVQPALSGLSSIYSYINKINSDRFQGSLKNLSLFSKELSGTLKIIDKSVFIADRLPNSLPLMNDFMGSLSKLQNISAQYGSIISRHNDLLNAIGYLSPYQKNTLLRVERRQKRSLSLDTVDFQNADIISFNIENTIAFVDIITDYKEKSDKPLTDIYDDELNNRIEEYGTSFLHLLQGAKESATSNNPDRIRHAAVSLRELVKGIINKLLPTDNEVAVYKNDEKNSKGKYSLAEKLECFFSGIQNSNLAPFIQQDIKSISEMTNILSKLTHVVSSDMSALELNYFIKKVECNLMLLMRYSDMRN